MSASPPKHTSTKPVRAGLRDELNKTQAKIAGFDPEGPAGLRHRPHRRRRHRLTRRNGSRRKRRRPPRHHR